jgi:hypothetical protein
MSDQTDGKPAATGRVALQDDPHRYRRVPIGSGPVGWAIERDGKIDLAHGAAPRGTGRLARCAPSRGIVL